MGDRTTTGPACRQCRTRKVRCDRSRPSCSNCRKASLQCDLNSDPRRVNHTMKLLESFSTLSCRLDSIETSIAKLTRHAEDDAASSSASSLRPPGLDPSSASTMWRGDVRSDFRSASSAVLDSAASSTLCSEQAYARHRPLGRYVHRVDINGHERYYGPTSVASMFGHTRMLVRAALGVADLDDGIEPGPDQLPAEVTKTREGTAALQALEEAFPYQNVCASVLAADKSVKGGKTVSRPPRPFLEPAVECFLAENNRVTPLFSRESLVRAMDEQYASAAAADANSWSLCFNNIIVLVMGARLRATKGLGIESPDLDEDIFVPFLENSRRALDRLDEYNQACFVNVQALTSLALVAAVYFPTNWFGKVLKRACSLAQEIGLQYDFPRKAGDDEERRSLFWTLYTLDKMCMWTVGQTCTLHLFESDTHLPISREDNVFSQCFVAKTEIMMLWEEIGLELYTSRAARQSRIQERTQIARLTARLGLWASKNKALLENVQSADLSPETCLRLELLYGFHLGQVLIHRCSDDSNSQQCRLASSRIALGIITDIYKSSLTMPGIYLLLRLFRFYSAVAFYEIHLQCLLAPHSPDYVSDMLLLNGCISAGNPLKHRTTSMLYCDKVLDGMSWCVRLNEIVHAAQSSRSALPPSVTNGTTHRQGNGLAMGHEYSTSSAGTVFAEQQISPRPSSSSSLPRGPSLRTDADGEYPEPEGFSAAAMDGAVGPYQLSKESPSSEPATSDAASVDLAQVFGRDWGQMPLGIGVPEDSLRCLQSYDHPMDGSLLTLDGHSRAPSSTSLVRPVQHSFPRKKNFEDLLRTSRDVLAADEQYGLAPFMFGPMS